LFRGLEDGAPPGAGAHFPELQRGHVLPGQARRWLSGLSVSSPMSDHP
jgi:hypothetical protein